MEEQRQDWRSRDKIGGAETRLEEQRRDWWSADDIGGAGTRLEGLVVCKDKSSIVCFLLNLGSWKSYDLGGARTRVEEQGRDWRSLEKDKTTII